MRICPACAFDRCDDTAVRCRQCGADLTQEEERVPSRESAWFHYVQIAKIGVVELVPGKAFCMGKDPRNELVLPRCPDAEAARLFWTDGYDEATVQLNQGARETVKVDGVRLSGVRALRGGEELTVGPLVMSYLKRATPIEGAIDAGRVARQRRGVDPGRAVATAPGAPRRSKVALEPRMRELPVKNGATGPREGRAAVVAPAAVARALAQKEAYGTLRVSSPRGRGWITVMKGAPKHATFGELRGRRALDAILRLERAQCQFVPGLPQRGSGEELELTFAQALGARKAASGPRPPQRAPARPPTPAPKRPGTRPPHRPG